MVAAKKWLEGEGAAVSRSFTHSDVTLALPVGGEFLYVPLHFTRIMLTI
jgi:hypothetical protein